MTTEATQSLPIPLGHSVRVNAPGEPRHGKTGRVVRKVPRSSHDSVCVAFPGDEATYYYQPDELVPLADDPRRG